MADHTESTDDGIGMELTKEDIPMDERKRFFIKIIMIIRQNFREYFGLEFANQCGYFVDNYMCKDIRDYGYWLEYPDGNHSLEGDSGENWSAAISSDGFYLFVGYEDNCIIKWDMLTLEKMDQWVAHDKTVATMIFRRGILVSGSNDRTVKVWNGHTNQLIHTLVGHTDWVASVDLNRNASQIISSSFDESMRLWSVETGECLRKITVHSERIKSVRFIDEFIISGSWDKSMKIINSSNGKQVKSMMDIKYRVYTVCINSDESMVACIFHRGFTIYTWPEMKMIRTIDSLSHRGDFHPINPDLLAVDNPVSKTIEIYNVRAGARIHVLDSHTDVLRSICYSPDGTRIVSTSRDTTTGVWDVSDI